jgi:hypothetical protein
VTHKITIKEAKQSLGKGKGTGKKGWFGSQARTTVAPKLNVRKAAESKTDSASSGIGSIAL